MKFEWSSRRADLGFSLIDVLVALFLVSTTAVVAMSMSGRGADEVRFQKRLIIARESIDFIGARIEANLDATTQANYTRSGSSVINAADNCGGGCSATRMANLDMFQWSTEIINNLPSSQFSIEINDTLNFFQVSVSVKWFEAGTDIGHSPDCNLTLTYNEVCITKLFTVSG